MTTVTLSPKFQVVIPKPVREELGLTVGQKLEAIVYDGRLVLIPVSSIRAFRGFLEGIDTTIELESDRV